MNKGILYYSTCDLDASIAVPVRRQIALSGLPIISVTLKPLAFGHNIVLDLQPSVVTLFRQILTGLEANTADVVYFVEHDVLYHPSHWAFEPDNDATYFYNVNCWRWDYPADRLIRYDNMRSLSGLCAARTLLLNHYRRRLALIEQRGWQDGRDPGWARRIGYEPGKLRRRGGIADEPLVDWQSRFPNIDIRHRHTLTPRKVTLPEFRHLPTGWREARLGEVEGWEDVRGMMGMTEAVHG
jgi:hypothetical protein